MSKKSAKPLYRKLPARSRFRQRRLWHGGDHLLLVVRAGHEERYSRYYFSDIQCIGVRAGNYPFWTWFGAVIFALLGALCLVAVLRATAKLVEGASEAVAAQVVFSVIGLVVFGVLFASSLLSSLAGRSADLLIWQAGVMHKVPLKGCLPSIQRTLQQIRPELQAAVAE
jgi:uncharacterized protein YacL